MPKLNVLRHIPQLTCEVCRQQFDPKFNFYTNTRFPIACNQFSVYLLCILTAVRHFKSENVCIFSKFLCLQLFCSVKNTCKYSTFSDLKWRTAVRAVRPLSSTNISGDRALIPRQSKKCRQKHGGFWPKIRHFYVTNLCYRPLTSYECGKRG